MDWEKVVMGEKKLSCGHDDDFVHALTTLVGTTIVIAQAVGALSLAPNTWPTLHNQLIKDFRRLFKEAGAEQPKLPPDFDK